MGHRHDATANLADAFTTGTADKTRRSERAVRRDVQRGKLGAAALAKLTGTSLDSGL
jgi:hypothetical protein